MGKLIELILSDRETIQLLLLARHYVGLAKEALQRVKDTSITVKQVAEFSIKYRPDSIDAENETFGHIASAAIRLATIAEKYENNGRLDLGKNYRTYLKEGHTIQETIDEVSRNLSEYIHILFRDIVGHTEETDKEWAKNYAEVREKVRPEITLAKAFDAVEKLHSKIEGELLREGMVIDC